jgi:hypothetical protein
VAILPALCVGPITGHASKWRALPTTLRSHINDIPSIIYGSYSWHDWLWFVAIQLIINSPLTHYVVHNRSHIKKEWGNPKFSSRRASRGCDIVPTFYPWTNLLWMITNLNRWMTGHTNNLSSTILSWIILVHSYSALEFSNCFKGPIQRGSWKVELLEHAHESHHERGNRITLMLQSM